MNKLKLIIPLVFILLNTSCATYGPTVRIETPEPAEDFVLVCDWSGKTKLNIWKDNYLAKRTVHVVKSGEETPCGVSYSFSDETTNVWLMHPVYWDGEKIEEDGRVVYRYTGTKLDYLDKQKEKFEAGFWDKHRNPGFAYANDLVGCGFPHQYFDYYSEVKKVDKEHFRQLYHEPILECKKRVIPIYNKYLSHEYSGKRPNAEESMNNLWESKGWGKYK